MSSKGLKATSNSDSIVTLYVDNLPLDLRKIWVFNLFTRFGKVVSVFLPKKRSKLTNQQFGFVRFSNEKDAMEAIEGINGKWFWNKKLVVHMAKYGGIKNTVFPTKQQVKGKMRVWIPKNFNQKDKCPLIAEPSRQVNGPIAYGAGSAMHQTKFQSIHIQPVGNGWLFRSAVAKIRRLLPSHELEKIFKQANNQVDKVRAIGGCYIIITCHSPEARDEIIKEKWISNWVEDIKPWNGEASVDERFAWISCYGMPLNGWSIPTFKLIGDCWGKFLQVDEKTSKEESFVRGRILIATEQVHKIMGTIELMILGKNYSVRIEEDESFRFIKSSLDQEPPSPLQQEQDEDDTGTKISNTNGSRLIIRHDGPEHIQVVENLLEPCKLALQLIDFGEEQQSQSPEVENTEDNNNINAANSNLSHGLESLVESSTGVMATGHIGGNIGNNDLSVPEPLGLNEHGFINTQLSVRASEIDGINLQVDLRPSQQRKLIREFVRNRIEEVEELARSQNNVPDEFQLTALAGRKLGINVAEDDIELLQKMIETETRDFKSLLRSSSVC